VKQTLGILTICTICCGLQAFAQQDRAPAPDNTKVNRQDAPTADQATNARTDRELMQKIRRSLMDDKSLSTYAHNVKIIASHGKVTLKGPVTSEEEKHSVEQKAADVAGAGNVTNELTIRAARAKRNKS
jgi:hyperosmotically inducible protein